MSETLLSIPIKGSYEVLLTDPLKAAFKEAGYSSKDPVVTQGIEEFQKFRNQVISKTLPKSYSSLELFYRYHDQLVSLINRLPALAKKPMNVIIYWDDCLDKGGLFGGKANIASASLDIERLCILFNIAALQSLLAAECRAADTDEEFKNAAKLFQSAASIMSLLSKCKVGGVPLTSDLKPEVVEALSSLMLAQAQEVFIDKAIKDKMKDTIIAKLCVQAEDMFADAAQKLNKDTIKHLWERQWINNVQAKKIGYSALSQYFQGLVCSSKKQFGEEIARLDFFLKNAKKAQEKMGNAKYLSVLITDAELKYKEAKKDNDFIYNEVIPQMDDLTPIDIVGSARLAKLGTVPTSFSSHFVDIFIAAAKKNGGGADGDSGPTIKSIINTAAGSLGQYLVNLSGAGKDKK